MISKKRAVKGFTLIELMISAAILVTVILPVIMLFYYYLVSMEMSRNTTIAVSDASFILENMRRADPFTKSNADAAYASALASRSGTWKLNNETIQIQDPDTDPMVVTVTVAWQDQVRIRNRVQAITTKMTAR